MAVAMREFLKFAVIVLRVAGVVAVDETYHIRELLGAALWH